MTAAEPAPAGQLPAGDPTAVVGSRIAAWVVDLVMFVALELLVVVALGERHHRTTCGALTKGHPASQCVSLGSSSYILTGPRFWLGTAITVAWFLCVFGLLQGLTGRSPGKALCRVRVVRSGGGPPGIGRSLLRSVCWAADGFPYVLGPVVGGVAMVSGTGHRRLGDLAAGTWVVGHRVIPARAPRPT